MNSKEGRSKEEILLIQALKRRVDIIIHPLNLCTNIARTSNTFANFPIEHAKSIVEEMHKFLRAWNKNPSEFKSMSDYQTLPSLPFNIIFTSWNFLSQQ